MQSSSIPVQSSHINRSARYDLELPLTLLMEDEELSGHTCNVSETGMLARFARPLDIWTEGTLSLLAGEHYLTLKARVVRTQDREAGFLFLLETENDRRAAEILLDAASAQVR